MVTIDYASDLHLEHNSSFRPKNVSRANILILAGDIMVAESIRRFPFYDNIQGTGSIHETNSQAYQDFLEHCSEQYEYVILIAGNHEHYQGRFDQVLETMTKACAAISPNVMFLNGDAFDYKDVTIVGTTLWTDFDNFDPIALYSAKSMMNDYRIIRFKDKYNNYRSLKPEDTFAVHIRDREFISLVEKNTRDRGRKLVVATHHAPSRQSIAPHYVHDQLSAAYASSLDEMIMDMECAKFWIHGHIHDVQDYMIGECNILANPRGYPNEGEHFSTFAVKSFTV